MDIFSLGMKADTRDLKRGQRDVDNFAKSGMRAEQQVTRANKNMGRSFSEMSGFIKAASAALSAFGAARLVREAMRVEQSMQSIQRTFTAATGSIAAGRKELEFTRKESERLGLNFENTAQSYAKLAAAARGTALEGKAARDVFTSVAQASTALGLSAEQSEGALNAIQQMISKGTVQAEELRGQLGERLPGAFQLAARAMGKTTAELGKMLEQGEVMAEDLLPKLALELNKTFSEQAAIGAQQLTAQINRLDNAVFELMAEGDLGGVSDAIGELADALSDPATQQGLASLINGMVKFAEWGAKAAAGVAQLAKSIGENLAAAVGGIALGDMDRLVARQQELNNLIDIQLQAQAKGRPLSENKRLQELSAELDAVEELIRLSRQLNEDSSEMGGGLELIDLSTLPKKIDGLKTVVAKTKELTEAQKQAAKDRRDSALQDLEFLEKEAKWLNEGLDLKEIDIRLEKERLAVKLKQQGLTDEEIKNYIKLNETIRQKREEIEAATDQADPFADAWLEAVKRIDEAFADAWTGAFDSFDDFTDQILDAFKRMIAEMAHQEITKPITDSLQKAISDGLSDGSGTGASGDWVSSLKTLAAGTAGSFVGTELGSSLTGREPGSNLGATAGTLIGGSFGGPVGAAIGGALGGLADSAFGGKGPWETRGSELELELFNGGRSAFGKTIDFQKRDGGALSSDDKRRMEAVVSSEMLNALTTSINATRQELKQQAGILGINISDEIIDTAIGNESFKISTTGKSSQQIKSEINKWLGDISNSMVENIAALHVEGINSIFELRSMAAQALADQRFEKELDEFRRNSLSSAMSFLDAAQEQLQSMAKAADDAAAKFDSLIDGLRGLGMELVTSAPALGNIESLTFQWRRALQEAAKGNADALDTLRALSGEYTKQIVDTSRTQLEATKRIAKVNAALLSAAQGVEGVKAEDQAMRQRQIEAAREAARAAAERGRLFGGNPFGMSIIGAITSGDADRIAGAIAQYTNIGGDRFGGSFEQFADQALSGNLQGIPGFANGGIHSGGVRMVGERGPEIEVTGPSRVISTSDLMQSMAGNDARMAKIERALEKIARNTGRTYTQLDRWDGDGLPEERAL